MSTRFVWLLESLRKHVYRGPLRRLFRTLRIERAIRRFYSVVLARLSEGGVVDQSVGDVTLQFVSETGLEVQRFQNLLEERDVLVGFLDELEEDDVFYDIGANVGIYSCFAATKLSSGHVFAFEPHPTNADRLAENVALNGFDESITIRREALSDEGGTADLAIAGTNQAGEGTHALSQGDAPDTTTVDVHTVRDLVENESIPEPTIAKIDVEGAELDTLRGFGKLLATNRLRVIYCEIHQDRIERFGGSSDELEQLLTDAGFAVEVLEDRGAERFIRASKRT